MKITQREYEELTKDFDEFEMYEIAWEDIDEISDEKVDLDD